MTSKLADQLRTAPDEGLAALIQLRPDLAVPVPSDISALASRAQSRVSVARALDGLDRFTLEVLDGLRLVRSADGTAAVEALMPLTTEAGVDAGQVRAAIDRLRARFLAYGDDTLHLVRAIDELNSPHPAGLGRPAAELDPDVAALVGDPARLRRTLLSAPPESRAVLDRLAVGPPVGTVSAAALRATVRIADPDPVAAPVAGPDGPDAPAQPPPTGPPGTDSPVRWLVAHHLLAAISDDTVELPLEVGVLRRRDNGPLGPVHPYPPEITGAPKSISAVDSAGIGQALQTIHHLDALIAGLGEAAPAVLRSGGLGVRELRRLARDTGLSEPDAALLLEVGYAAGLLGQGDPAGPGYEQKWLPTPAYDAWRGAPLATRWARLGRTWYATIRTPVLVGSRDDKDRPINALSGDTMRLGTPATRRAVLRVLAELPVGTGPDPDELLARLAWQAPRRAGRPGSSAGPHALARAVLAEAATLGLTGLGALTGYGRLLVGERTPGPSGGGDPIGERPWANEVDDDPLGIRLRDDTPPDALVAALDRLLPVPVDHVLVQADLTVVVPGPPEPTLAAELALVADAESRGGATVFRVTPASVRRALDTGYPATDIHDLFRRRSRTPLPQALSYLIDDVARRHGGLRAGSAAAYLRSEDAALISEVFADRRLAPLGLRRLAPTVLVSPYPTGRLLAGLREAGYAPVAEDATGTAVLARPKAPRAPARPLPRLTRPEDIDPPRLAGPRLAGVIEQIRLGDRLARSARRSPLTRGQVSEDRSDPPAQVHIQALATLQQALREQTLVWVGYVDSHGGPAARLVRPVSMGAGYLRAEDDRTETLHTFALHRITSAVIDEG
jgi:Helicase conserved C-terminal domain